MPEFTAGGRRDADMATPTYMVDCLVQNDDVRKKTLGLI
jgi:hypothetical protein